MISFIKLIKKNKIYLTSNKIYKSNKQLSNLSLDSKKKVYFKANGNLMNAGVYFLKKLS